MIRLATFGSAAILCLAACGSPSEEPASNAASETPATQAPAPSPTAGTPASAADKLSAQGFGPLRIGMTRSEVEAALGADANPNAVGGPDPESCDMFHPARAPDGLLVMLEKGILTSVWATRGSAVETDRALNIGDPAAEVKRVYGAAADVSPHKYQDAPAEYVTVWSGSDHSSPAARGVKYTIGGDGRVESIAGGGPSIAYVEGCA